MPAYQEKEQFFDRFVDQWEREGFAPPRRAKVEAVIARAGVGPGMTVLEPGCGTGRVTAILSERVGPAGLVIAVDISRKMIEACRRVADRPNVRAVVGAVETMGVAAQSVDRVLCFAAFPHFGDKTAALALFRRCLKPDGRVIVAHLMGSQAVNAHHRKAGAPIAADTLPDAPGMEALFRDAGFRIDELQDDESGYYLSAGVAR